MAILTSDTSHLADLRHRLDQWIKRRHPTGCVQVLNVEGASSANGYSNETYRVTVERDGASEHLILRLPPSKQGFFPDYDVARQYAFLNGLRDAPGVPMATCRSLELDPEVLGHPFFLVDYEPGQIPADEPLYLDVGWVVDATDAQRETFWRSTVDALAALSKVRWSGERLAAVDWSDTSRPRGEQHLELFDRWIKWGGRNVPCPERPLMVELRQWLSRNLPADEEPGVVWGDSRQGNIIYRDFRPVALLDWELAVIGDPEVDIAYMHLMRRHQLNQHKSTGKPSRRLDGFLGDAEAIEHYNRHAAKPVRNYRYYWLLNAYKTYALLQSFSDLLLSVGAVNQQEMSDIRSMPCLWNDVELVFGDEDHSAFFPID